MLACDIWADIITGSAAEPPAPDPRILHRIPAAKIAQSRSVGDDTLKALRAIGKLGEHEQFHYRREADGDWTILRGPAPDDGEVFGRFEIGRLRAC